MEPQVQWIEDLGVEFARVARLHERRSSWTRRRASRALAVAASALVLMFGGAYAVPTTRGAIDDLTSSIPGWVSGGDGDAPADAPSWVREEGGRTIAETDGVRLYVSHVRTDAGTLLRFTLANGSAVFDTAEGWEKRFANHQVIVLGTAPLPGGGLLDKQGRFPLLGVTGQSVVKVELCYADGPPLVSEHPHGGFVLMADARRHPQSVVVYDAGGQTLDRADVSLLGPE
jgi:hypothetical protein